VYRKGYLEEDNIKMDLKEIWWQGVGWIHIAGTSGLL
jgi:hypothetical protein